VGADRPPLFSTATVGHILARVAQHYYRLHCVQCSLPLLSQ